MRPFRSDPSAILTSGFGDQGCVHVAGVLPLFSRRHHAPRREQGARLPMVMAGCRQGEGFGLRINGGPLPSGRPQRCSLGAVALIAPGQDHKRAAPANLHRGSDATASTVRGRAHGTLVGLGDGISWSEEGKRPAATPLSRPSAAPSMDEYTGPRGGQTGRPTSPYSRGTHRVSSSVDEYTVPSRAARRAAHEPDSGETTGSAVP